MATLVFGMIRFLLLGFLLVSPPVAPSVASPVDSPSYRLSGYVTEAESHECLIGAVVWSGDNWTVTNDYGFYSLELEEGKHTVSCSYLGRQAEDVNIEIRADATVHFKMNSVESLKGAVVQSHSGNFLTSPYPGALKMSSGFISNIPAVFGEPDLLKSLQKVPGVQSGMEGFSGIYVRGGGNEENLMLLDGIPIYNPSHVLGIFSCFTPEAIKQFTLYKGFFPARYGGRASSVIDVRTKDGNAKEFGGSVNVGLLDARICLEGPLFKDRTSFGFSLRGMNTLVAYPVLRLLKSPYFFSFYDINAKITHRFKNSDRLVITAYHGKDNFDYSQEKQTAAASGTEEFTIGWGNTMAGARWNHTFAGSLFSNLSLSWTSYGMKELYTLQKQEVKDGADIYDIIISWDLEYSPSPSHNMDFGVSNTVHSYTTGIGCESSIYFQDDVKFGFGLDLSAGLRASVITVPGKVYPSIEPRLSINYQFFRAFSANISYTRMSQYSHLLVSGDIGLPTDLWVPVTDKIKPVFSDQVSVGLNCTLSDAWNFALEGYYKKAQNVLEYRDLKLFYQNASNWENLVESGIGESRGLEFLAEKKKGPLTGMLSYTLSKTDRVFPDGSVNEGRPFPFKYDRRHVVNLCSAYSFNERVSVNAAFFFASGCTMTVSTRPTAVIEPDGTSSVRPYSIGRNNYRLPPSHRLDVSASFRKQKRRGERVWTVGIYNLYCARNPNWVVGNSETVMIDGHQVTVKYLSQITFLPILPSVSYTFNF